MKVRIIVLFYLIILSASNEAFAQKGKKGKQKEIFTEFQEVSLWYKKLPFLAELKFQQKSFPETMGEDNLETVMNLYYGVSEYYMMAEGIEQIANDSFMVLVNQNAKMITVYPGTKSVRKRLEQSGLMIADDSTKKAILSKFEMSSVDSVDLRRIHFISREKMNNTKWPKEELTIHFNPGTKTPVLFEQVKRVLVPIDSVDYETLKSDKDYLDRCLKVNVENRDLYFFIRDHLTNCEYKSIIHDMVKTPKKTTDRVIQQPDGAFRPAKGFEEYAVTIER